jgi:hypothetical protein
MSLSRDEAAEALAAIDKAGGRVRDLGYYADLSPCLIAWGLIWLVANLLTEIRPAWAATAWPVGWVLGTPVTIWSVWRQSRRTSALVRQAGGDPRVIGRRIALIGAIGFGFYIALSIIVAPLTPRQVNAFISMVVAFGYAFAGIWGGRRFLAIGIAAGAAILFGYLFLHQHFYLWMGLTAGGALLLGGFWLRKP